MAGKTGTAEIDIARRHQRALVHRLHRADVAVAVMLERVQGGTGGIVAAPIAKQVLEALGEQ